MKVEGVPVETLRDAYLYVVEHGDLTEWGFRLHRPKIKIGCDRIMGGRMTHRLIGQGWAASYTLNDDEQTGIRAYPGSKFETLEFQSKEWRLVSGGMTGDPVAYLRDMTELKMLIS